MSATREVRLGALVLTTVALSSACFDNAECTALRAVHGETTRALAAARGRAALADRTAAKLEKVKSETERKLDELGLDLAEGDLLATLEGRAKASPGVTLERTVRPAELEIRAPASATPQTETVFRFSIPAKTLSEAWETSGRLMATPPQTRLLSLLAPRAKGEPWRLELGRPDVQRIELDVKPRPLPHRRRADEVPSQLGLCGASKLRGEIEAMETELGSLAEKAAATTVNLPLEASWTGLSRRADRVLLVEREARRIATALVEGVLSSKQRLIGLAVDESALLLEIAGGPKERGKVQTALPTDVLEAAKMLDAARDGVARMAVANRVAEAARRPDGAAAPRSRDVDGGGEAAHPHPEGEGH